MYGTYIYGIASFSITSEKLRDIKLAVSLCKKCRRRKKKTIFFSKILEEHLAFWIFIRNARIRGPSFTGKERMFVQTRTGAESPRDTKNSPEKKW